MNNLVIGNKYNWKAQQERLVYVGKDGHWNQFELIDNPGIVWCEALDGELNMIENTK